LFPVVSQLRRRLDRDHGVVTLWITDEEAPDGTHTMFDNRSAPNDPLCSRKEAARYLTELGLETAPQTLARKFHEGTGPLCTHVGDRAMYRKSHLDAYFESQVSAPRRSSGEPRRLAGDPVRMS
jgi:hypothetical protein